MPNYVNYHCHSHYSNAITPDVVIRNEDRAKRVVELGMSVLSGIEHGWTGRVIEIYQLAKQYGIKPLFGTEAYFVTDRHDKKDKTNSHLIILAKNENGRKAINRILSEANVTGYYYKARVDFELLFSLPKNDVWLTSACLGGIWKYENHEEIFSQIISYFGENFFFEVQTHPVEQQKEINRKVLELSKKYGVKYMAGMDSHIIHPEQKKDRDEYLKSRGIVYEDESGWLVDFPSYEVAFSRFQEQDVLSDDEIEIALQNTNIFETVEKYHSVIFEKNIKLPSLYKNESQEQRNKRLEDLVNEKWNTEKIKVPFSKWKLYEEEIKKELDVVWKTNIADYFLLDYEIIKHAKEIGGQLTLTGRGSAPSYYLCKLLGFTTIDRVSAEVKLFPERFISAERLLEAKSLPDIDLNCGNPEVFAQAQEDILGVGHSYKMIAFGKVKELKSWKMYSRQAGVDFEVANMVSSQIKEFEEALKYADEEEKEFIKIEDYLSIEHMELFNEGKKFLGLVDTLNPHPCAYGIFDDGDMREEFGIIKIKENICVCLDGKWAEDYKMLKNDLLKVQVVELIYETYKKIGIEPHPLPELISLCNKDKKVWDVYSKGMTVSVNQFEKETTSKKGVRYSPKNISEISAFVAAIRPGFKSEYSHFESRGKFEYGVMSLDKILQTDEFPYSYMLYQENSMAVMGWSGIPMYQTYEIVKSIAKKRYEDVLKNKSLFIDGMKKRLLEVEKMSSKDAEDISKKTWQIIEDSAFYSFNASHSYSVAGDSLYCAWLKTNHPIHFYETFIKMMEKDGDKERMELAKQEAIKFFGINFPHPEFGQDNRNIIAIPERNEITQSLNIYKGFGDSIGESMYKLGTEFKDGDFLDLLIFAEENGMMSSKIETLIKLNYFSQFGKNKKLYNIFTEFRKGKSKYTSKLSEKSKIKRKEDLKIMFEKMKDEKFSDMEQVANEISILGRLETKFTHLTKRYGFVVGLEVGERGSPKAIIQSLRLGNVEQFKVSRNVFMKNEFSEGQILFLPDGGIEKKPSKRPTGKTDAKGKPEFEDIPDKFDFWITNYSPVSTLLI